jgi:hypothetical protein
MNSQLNPQYAIHYEASLGNRDDHRHLALLRILHSALFVQVVMRGFSKTGAFSNIKLGVASQEVEQSEEDIKEDGKAAAKDDAY